MFHDLINLDLMASPPQIQGPNLFNATGIVLHLDEFHILTKVVQAIGNILNSLVQIQNQFYSPISLFTIQLNNQIEFQLLEVRKMIQFVIQNVQVRSQNAQSEQEAQLYMKLEEKIFELINYIEQVNNIVKDPQSGQDPMQAMQQNEKLSKFCHKASLICHEIITKFSYDQAQLIHNQHSLNQPPNWIGNSSSLPQSTSQSFFGQISPVLL